MKKNIIKEELWPVFMPVSFGDEDVKIDVPIELLTEFENNMVEFRAIQKKFKKLYDARHAEV